ncbi:YbaY family lipoprotein [Dyella caseinilytica]|uniref:YbaY family lipoprotein n=1 Tax=Dyella caseinilytica TaxID=1849581 RepID=A0ABX7GVB4_9GAMM|nr:YbaY family lipoprotein [Dyella caseinilytica]QRN53956.1 YbaY family lipoprotein [Dyella caseinilytica]
MRSVVWSLMTVAAVALAGCNNSSNPSSSTDTDGQSAATQAAAANSVSGTITLRGGITPSSQDNLVISLVDVTSQGSAPLATKTIAPATTFPLQFELNFNTANVAPNDLYIVQVELTDGDRHYSMPIQAPVLTKGNPTANVAIELAPEQTASEKLLAAFQGLQKQIGGMKRSSGTKLEPNASRAWQVFRDGTEVKFIRELVDYGDKGFTSTDYAYKDGKPWVVQQQKKANQGAKPTSTDTAGWGDDGSLVLKTHDAGGTTEALSDSDAGNLQQQAKDVLNLATGGKGK